MLCMWRGKHSGRAASSIAGRWNRSEHSGQRVSGHASKWMPIPLRSSGTRRRLDRKFVESFNLDAMEFAGWGSVVFTEGSAILHGATCDVKGGQTLRLMVAVSYAVRVMVQSLSLLQAAMRRRCRRYAIDMALWAAAQRYEDTGGTGLPNMALDAYGFPRAPPREDVEAWQCWHGNALADE
eukprot:5717786-Amphidinium_carterae.1